MEMNYYPVLGFIALGRIYEHGDFGDDQVIALGRILEHWGLWR
jgi:hypothetical protein